MNCSVVGYLVCNLPPFTVLYCITLLWISLWLRMRFEVWSGHKFGLSFVRGGKSCIIAVLPPLLDKTASRWLLWTFQQVQAPQCSQQPVISPNPFTYTMGNGQPCKQKSGDTVTNGVGIPPIIYTQTKNKGQGPPKNYTKLPPSCE